MRALSRLDTSIVGRWWWTVDRWVLGAFLALIVIGLVLILAASPAVANRIGLDQFFFVRKQLLFLLPSLAVIFAVSLLPVRGVRRLGAVIFVITIVLMVLTLLIGPEIKGARRWLQLGFFSLQPSEFVKPGFAIVTAWMFAAAAQEQHFPGRRIAIALYLLVAGLLVLQPDIGMTLVVSAVWFAQFFLAGLSLVWVGAFSVLALAGMVLAYSLFPHVAARVDRFLDPSAENYQIDRAMEAFANGGLFGTGPGEGAIKRVLPDAHTDFIFAVAGEEFGLFAGLLVIALFAFIVLRGFARLYREEDFFVMIAAGGLLIQMGLQAMINIGVNLQLLPTKGMTLPFISYGGSSTLSLSLAAGMILALTRHRPPGEGTS